MCYEMKLLARELLAADDELKALVREFLAAEKAVNESLKARRRAPDHVERTHRLYEARKKLEAAVAQEGR